MLRSSVSGSAMSASRASTARAANASAVEHQVRQLAQQLRDPSCSRARPRRRWRARPCDRAATPTARSLQRDRERGAAVAAEPRGRDGLDQLARRVAAQVGQRSVQVEVRVEPRCRCLADAEQQAGQRRRRRCARRLTASRSPSPRRRRCSGRSFSWQTRLSVWPAPSVTRAAMLVPCSEVTWPLVLVGIRLRCRASPRSSSSRARPLGSPARGGGPQGCSAAARRATARCRRSRLRRRLSPAGRCPLAWAVNEAVVVEELVDARVGVDVGSEQRRRGPGLRGPARGQRPARQPDQQSRAGRARRRSAPRAALRRGAASRRSRVRPRRRPSRSRSRRRSPASSRPWCRSRSRARAGARTATTRRPPSGPRATCGIRTAVGAGW